MIDHNGNFNISIGLKDIGNAHSLYCDLKERLKFSIPSVVALLEILQENDDRFGRLGDGGTAEMVLPTRPYSTSANQ